jgi:hypothetical protein
LITEQKKKYGEVVKAIWLLGLKMKKGMVQVILLSIQILDMQKRINL